MLYVLSILILCNLFINKVDKFFEDIFVYVFLFFSGKDFSIYMKFILIDDCDMEE